MIERSSDAWEHNMFKDIVVRVANIEMYVNRVNGASLNFNRFSQILQGFNLLSSRAAKFAD
jgi:hypothetical protein